MIFLKQLMVTFIIYMSPLMNDQIFSMTDHDVQPKTIGTYEEDITGDGMKERIKLKGYLLTTDSDYYRKVWAEISNPNGREWKINYEGGYNPRLEFLSLTNNDATNILYQTATKSNSDAYQYSLHTMQNLELKKTALPQQDHIIGNYKDSFIIELSLEPDEKPIIIDISHQAKEYIAEGVYDEKGRVLHSTSVHIEDISLFEPILRSDRNGYALKSYQHVKGRSDEDELGTIETIWTYENSAWTILKTKYVFPQQ
ncbi:MAG TPA: hypothetical protein VK077_08385 [Virgibacillus sp.]|nr:hypothetical protein [Virgibacillus sp.]